MNKKITIIAILTACLGMTLNSCKMDLPNVNQPYGNEVPKTKDGIYALSVGLRTLYSTDVIAATYFYPAVTSRELKGVATFTNTLELEAGGKDLPTANGNILAYWTVNQKLMGISETILANASNIPTITGGTLSAIIAHAKLYKAIALGNLAAAFEQSNIQTDLSGKAPFVARQQVLETAVKLLNEAIQEIQTTPASSEFNSTIAGPNFNLTNVLYAFAARYNLMAGKYTEAYNLANKVDPTSKNQFQYTALAQNPLWHTTINLKYYAAHENLGLPAGLFDAGDKRISFYTGLINNALSLKGFALTQNGEVPVYLPDEMKLIKAEALLRNNGSLTEARDLINEVRTQTASDLFNVNAGLPAYAGAINKNDLLLEVYKQRCAELFMSGLRLEDSRRFGRPAPPQNTTERNRNFYPYPDQERIGNPNTPADPEI